MQTNTKLNWRMLYFGPVTKAEVTEAIQDEWWQEIRKGMKGKTLEEKYRILRQYYRDALDEIPLTVHAIRMLNVRVTNYVTALSRGGLIKPEDYR